MGLLYAMHWPFRQYESARGIRRSPLHDRLAAAGPSWASWPAGSAPTGMPPGGRNRSTSTPTANRTGSPTSKPSVGRCADRWGCSIRPRSPSSRCRGPTRWPCSTV
ncbi:MAG: hypothetical protein GY698_13365 [Actinomycetia bacterium]|nr:hypothetical protein [Actinomycetes bacterium]